MFSKSVLLFLAVYFSSGYSYELKTEKFFREDYTYIKAVESFYKIHTTTQKWTEAKRVCALEGAILWHPDDDDEAREVKTFWRNTKYNIEWVYVGLSDILAEGDFKTIDGKSVSKVYNKWEPGQPNDKNGREDCVYLYRDYQLDDWPCDFDYHFICKKTLQSLELHSHCNSSVSSDGQDAKTLYRKDYHYMENEDSYYKIHTSPKTWSKAKQMCELEDATLWYPDDDTEARAVRSYWETTQPQINWIYVGLSNTTTGFKTIDGKSVSTVYNQWALNQPNNNGECVYMYKEGDLGDWSCNAVYSFICKKSRQSLEWYYHCNMSDSNGQIVERPKKFFRNDYTYIGSEESFYKIHTSPQTWADAKRVCALEGATFWYPENDEEANAVISFWNTTQSHIGWVYVGMSDKMAKGLFETVDGKLISEVYNKWQPGKPDNYGGSQDCIYIYKAGGIDDYDCDYEYHFICKKTLQSLQWNQYCNMSDPDYILNKNNGKCYKVHTTPLTWTEAYTTCRREQSHLAVISNQHEMDYLVNLTESTPKPRVKHDYERGIYHMGFHNKFNEGWQTVRGTPMSAFADAWWDSYKPADDRDQCGSMFYTGRLTNIDCDMKSFFICEHQLPKSLTELEVF